MNLSDFGLYPDEGVCVFEDAPVVFYIEFFLSDHANEGDAEDDVFGDVGCVGDTGFEWVFVYGITLKMQFIQYMCGEMGILQSIGNL